MRLPLRSINTNIWDDSWFEELNPTNKLLWLNLLTNKRSNLLGIFEVSARRAAFETGVGLDLVKDGWNLFRDDKKVTFVGNFVIMRNFLKNQTYNANMKKSVISIFNYLPTKVKGTNKILHKDDVEHSMALIHKLIENHFVTIPNGKQTTKESEREREGESEYESERESSLFAKFLKIYLDFYKGIKNIPYKENSAEDEALQDMINYFQKITKSDKEAIALFQLMLDNYKNWDDFHKKQLLISEVNKNIPNILNKLHNEQGNKKSRWSEDIEALQAVIETYTD